MARKIGRTTNFFSSLSLLLFLDPGSEIRDPGSGMDKNQDPRLSSRIHNTANRYQFSVLFDPVQEVQGLRPPERPPHIYRAAPRLKPSHHHHSQGQYLGSNYK